MSHDKSKRRSRHRGARTNEGPWRAFLVPGMDPAKAVAYAKSGYEQHQIELSLVRKMVNLRGMARLCRRKGCRRAGVCSGPECLVDAPAPTDETPEDAAALRALYDHLKASVAAADD